MRRVLLPAVVALVAAAVAAPAQAAAGPPGGTIYVDDVAWRTVATPTSLPDRGPFDVIYVFPDCADCASVSESAPGDRDYNGGRWKVVAAHGIDRQLTDDAAVLAEASALVDTGIRFVCPLIRA